MHLFDHHDRLSCVHLALCAGTLRVTYSVNRTVSGVGLAQTAAIMAMRLLRLPPDALGALLNNILQQPRCDIMHAPRTWAWPPRRPSGAARWRSRTAAMRPWACSWRKRVRLRCSRTWHAV